MYGRSRVLINQPLLDRVLQIKHNEFLHSESYDTWKADLIEDIELTRLGEMAESLDENETAVLILVALQKYPELVFQILTEEFLINKERTNKRNDK